MQFGPLVERLMIERSSSLNVSAYVCVIFGKMYASIYGSLDVMLMQK